MEDYLEEKEDLAKVVILAKELKAEPWAAVSMEM